MSVTENKYYLNVKRTVSVLNPGVYKDFRPGTEPEKWEYRNTYPWPAPKNSNNPTIISPSPLTLIPAFFHEDWESTASDTGPFRRNNIDDFYDTTNPSILDGWYQYPRLNSKDWVIMNKRNNNGGADQYSLWTKSVLPGNAGLVIDFCAKGPALFGQTVLTLEFGDTDTNKSFKLNINENGKGYLSRGDGSAVKDQLAEGYLIPNRWDSIFRKWVRICILPTQRNGILITSSLGGSFVWYNSDLPKTYSRVPNITKQGKLRTIPFTHMAFQPRPIAYFGERNESELLLPAGTVGGYVRPKVDYPSLIDANKPINGLPLMSAPSGVLHPNQPSLFGTNDDLDHLTWKNVGVIIEYKTPLPKSKDNQEHYIPTAKLHRPNTSHEDMYHTPHFYRHEGRQKTVSQETLDEVIDITKDVIQFDHELDNGKYTGILTMRNGQNWDNLKGLFNIPFQWKQDDSVRFQAVIANPKIIINGGKQFLEWQLQDQKKYLENNPVGSIGRFDGMSLNSATQEILLAVGFPKDGSLWEIDDTSAYVDISKGEADADSKNLSDYIKTASDWLDYLCDTYTSSSEYPFKWVYGWYQSGPSYLKKWKFYFKDPKNIGTTPVYTFYPTHYLAELKGYGNYAQADSYKAVHTSFEKTVIEPECNAFWVIGFDEDGKPLQSYKDDKKSIKADTPINDRPANWLGETRLVIYMDSALNTQDLVNAACGKMFKRLSRARHKATMLAPYKPDLKAWDTIKVYDYIGTGRDSSDYKKNLLNHDWKIVGISGKHKTDSDSKAGMKNYIEGTYQLERWYEFREIPV